MDREKLLLAKVTEYDVVEIHNPLTDDFVGKVARTYAHRKNDPVYAHAKQQYGIDLNNPQHTSKKHVQQTITIPSGKSLKLPGDVAKVIINQLVKEMMQREGFKRQMADPDARRTFEERVVVNKEKLDFSDDIETAEEKLDRQIRELNEEPEKVEETDEEAFPGTREEADSGANPAQTKSGSDDKKSKAKSKKSSGKSSKKNSKS